MNNLVSADIEAYAQAHSIPESDLCRALREETQRRMVDPQMIVGPLEGAFLKMMTQLVQATRVLEIGMFTGYSALCFAEALPADGTVDNVLWDSAVLQQPAPDESTAAIQELNRLVVADPRVTAVLVTVRDGILVVRPQP